MKRLLLSLSIFFIMGCLSAQQDAMYTHYMFNTLAVNPGYAGSRNALTLTALHRSQWLDFPGAPVTQTFTIHGPAFADRLGLGLSFVNDKIGPLKTTSVYADVAYRLTLDDNSILAFGLKGGLNYVRGDFNDLLLEESDAVFDRDEASKAKPNFGFGLYYHRERFYAGFSAPGILQNEFVSVAGNELQSSFFDQQRHYFLILGGVINLNDDVLYKPTTFTKVTSGAPIQFDITNTVIFREKYHLGLMYRTGDALGLLLGFTISDQLHAGYSFDWSMANSTSRYNDGSHELMIRYDFVYKHRKKIKSPRYF